MPGHTEDKMMNQMCIAGVVQGLSEAINFGINAGLDIDKVMESLRSIGK